MKHHILACAASLALLAPSILPAAAADLPMAQPKDVGMSQERLARLDAVVDAAVHQGRFPGAVVMVARHGRVVDYKAFGLSDPKTKRAMKTDDIFRIYSMTKPVMGIALMMLYEEGKFQLNDPLEKYIPAFKGLKVFTGADDKGGMILADAKRKPTIQDILRHTSGLSNAGTRGPVEKCYLDQGITFTTLESLDQEMNAIAKCPLAYQPGTRWLYAKNADVQAYLVERFSGMPIAKFLEERLFKPLGMTDTAYGEPPAKANRYAQYGGPIPFPDPSGPGLDMRPETYRRFSTRSFGTEGLSSTAMDYGRLAQMLANGGELDGVRILSRKTVELMTQDNLPPGVTAGGPGTGWGLGYSVVLNTAAAGSILSPGTFGWTGAATTSFSIDPKEGLVVVVMAQAWPEDFQVITTVNITATQAITD